MNSALRTDNRDMRWFLGVTLLLLAALLLGLGLLAYAMYALLAVMLISRLLSRAWAQNLSAVRECNRYAANIGDTVAVVITVRNEGRLPVAWVLVEDLLPRRALAHNPPMLRVEGTRMRLAMLRANGALTMLYQLRLTHRGYFQIGPLVLETGDLFGLHRRYRVLTSPTFLLVYPEAVPLEGYDVASRRPIGEVRMTHRLYEDPTRIAGVRQYQAGDPLNRVHWRATARTGALHSKVYEPSTVAGATILLDFHQAAYDPRHEPYRSELAVTAAASVASALYHMGQQVGLVTNGRDAADRIRRDGWDADHRSRKAARQAAEMLERSDRLQPLIVPTRRGPEQLMRILETLARVELTDGLDFPHLILETASRLPRDATAVAILPSIRTETAVALGDLCRRGLSVTVILNLYELGEFEHAYFQLLSEGITVRHLKDRDSIPTICRDYVVG